MTSNLTYKMTVTTLTPLHIGSGTRLREGFDFISHDDAVWIANQARLMDSVLRNAAQGNVNLAEAASRISGLTLQQMMERKWLLETDFDLERRIFRYRLPGRTTTTHKMGELHEFIKDVYGQPYLPGSSMKGALRSLLLRSLARNKKNEKPRVFYTSRFDQRTRKVRLDSRPNSKEAAAWVEARYFQPTSPVNQRPLRMDDTLFHLDDVNRRFAVASASRRREDAFRNPNYDLGRALHIFDSEPLSLGDMALARVQVMPAKQSRSEEAGSVDMDVEVLPAGIQLVMQMQVNTWLFDDTRAEKLGFSAEQRAWLARRLVYLAKMDAQNRLLEEDAFLERLQEDMEDNAPAEFREYGRHLIRLGKVFQNLKTNEFMLQVGKGAGWRSKTIGQVLVDHLDDEEFGRMVEDFNLGKGKWKRSGRLPRTRSLASAEKQAFAPMGWVKVRLETKT